MKIKECSLGERERKTLLYIVDHWSLHYRSGLPLSTLWGTRLGSVSLPLNVLLSQVDSYALSEVVSNIFSICIQYLHRKLIVFDYIESHEGSSILENFISRIESKTKENVDSIILKNCEGGTFFTITICRESHWSSAIYTSKVTKLASKASKIDSNIKGDPRIDKLLNRKASHDNG